MKFTGKATAVREKQFRDKSRYVQQYRGEAVRAGKAALTRAMKGHKLAVDYSQTTLDEITGQYTSALKEGVVNMAEGRLSGVLTSEELAKIRSMDAAKLEGLYKADRFVFQTYYSYAGINERGGALDVDQGKAEDARYLIAEYERAWGKIKV